MILTTEQAAAKLSLSVVRVKQFCRAGRLKARKLGGIWLIESADLDAFARLERKPGRPRKDEE